MKELLEYLMGEIERLKEYDDPMNTASWGYEEGILITGNDAQLIIDTITELNKQ